MRGGGLGGVNKSLKKARTDLEASELVDKLGRISFTVMLIPLQLGLRASRPSTVGVTHKSQVDISSDPETVRTVRDAQPSRPALAAVCAADNDNSKPGMQGGLACC